MRCFVCKTTPSYTTPSRVRHRHRPLPIRRLGRPMWVTSHRTGAPLQPYLSFLSVAGWARCRLGTTPAGWARCPASTTAPRWTAGRIKPSGGLLEGSQLICGGCRHAYGSRLEAWEHLQKGDAHGGGSSRPSYHYAASPTQHQRCPAAVPAGWHVWPSRLFPCPPPSCGAWQRPLCAPSSRHTCRWRGTSVHGRASTPAPASRCAGAAGPCGAGWWVESFTSLRRV